MTAQQYLSAQLLQSNLFTHSRETMLLKQISSQCRLRSVDNRAMQLPYQVFTTIHSVSKAAYAVYPVPSIRVDPEYFWKRRIKEKRSVQRERRKADPSLEIVSTKQTLFSFFFFSPDLSKSKITFHSHQSTFSYHRVGFGLTAYFLIFLYSLYQTRS